MYIETTTKKCTQRLTSTPRDVHIEIISTNMTSHSTIRVINNVAIVKNLNSDNIKEFTKQLSKAGFDTNLLAPSTMEEIRKLHNQMA